MVVDAFTDLVFTPDSNRRNVALTEIRNEENNSTQPMNSSLIPTSPRDVGSLSYLNSPRYLLPSPNASLENPILSPLLRSSPDAAVFRLQSPLPPLTPLGDLPTPHSWSLISPRGLMTPSVFVGTPKSSSQDKENEKLSLTAQDNLKGTEANQKEREDGNSPSVLKVRTIQVRNPEEKKDAEQNGHPFSFSHDNARFQRQEKLPDVRRRLFDECGDEMSLIKTNAEQILPQIAKPNLLKPQSNVRKGPGLKSRITPPPQIAIPTNPLSRHRIQEMPKEQILLMKKDFYPSQGIMDASRASSSHPEIRDEAQLQKRSNNLHRQPETFNLPRHSSEMLIPGPIPTLSGPEGKRIVMTSEASSVLAELKRQRSQVEARKENSSSVPVQESLKISGPNERTCCNCKASQCIKRYCPCFATSNFCGPECGCRNCENTLNNSSCVGIARKALIERDPNAFVPRIRSSQRQKARGRQTIRGCNCRKGCEKNYCICKENGLVCGVRCTCSGPNGCQNQDQSKLNDIQQVIENMPKSEYSITRVDNPKTMDIHEAVASSRTAGRDQQDVQMKTENLVSYESQEHVAELPKNSADPVLASNTGYPALPTPTTPSVPYNPFFGQSSSKKRSMTFGELSDGFKRIKVSEPNDVSLPELKQSSATPSDASRSPGKQIASQLPSNETKPLSGRETTIRDSHVIHNVNGAYHALVDDDKLQRVPRILRYKFGSGKSAGSLKFPR